LSIIPIPRLKISMPAMATVSSVFAVLLLATPAQALEDNRNVERGCGTNHVSSGYNGQYSWAQTTRVSGDCQGRLSAALEYHNGYWSERKYGTKQEVFVAEAGPRAKHGLHWGCDDCNVTKS
jgi:hypothetical protein